MDIHPKPTFNFREYISFPFSSTKVMCAAHDSQQSKHLTTISKRFTKPSGTSSDIFIHASIYLLFFKISKILKIKLRVVDYLSPNFSNNGVNFAL
ncbi:MAG: hypothetical protein ACTSRH_07385 [Promethearchaeota archaeon]